MYHIHNTSMDNLDNNMDKYQHYSSSTQLVIITEFYFFSHFISKHCIMLFFCFFFLRIPYEVHGFNHYSITSLCKLQTCYYSITFLLIQTFILHVYFQVIPTITAIFQLLCARKRSLKLSSLCST